MRESNATSPSKHKLIGTTKKNTEVPKITHQKADSSNKQSRSRSKTMHGNKELAGVPSVKDARNFKNKPVIENLIRTAKRKTFIAKIQEDVDKSNLTDLQNTLDSQNHEKTWVLLLKAAIGPKKVSGLIEETLNSGTFFSCGILIQIVELG
jgi:hypothetical protein